MTYKYLRSAGLLLSVFCLFLICYSNHTAVAAPAKTEVVIAKECSRAGHHTFGGEESDDYTRSLGRHDHLRVKKIRRGIDLFLKQPFQDNAFGYTRPFTGNRAEASAIHSPDYKVRPFYYVLLFRDALF